MEITPNWSHNRGPLALNPLRNRGYFIWEGHKVRSPGDTRWPLPPRAALARKEVRVDMDMAKLLLFLLAVYGTYHSAKTAWRLGNELFG
jgi:hypothetical protein